MEGMRGTSWWRAAGIAGLWFHSACGSVSSGGGDAGGDPDAPEVTALDPDTGIVGTAVTLTGRRFGADQGSAVVTFGGTEAVVTSWSDTSIEVALPDVYPGDVPVQVASDTGESGPLDFHVILPQVIYLNSNLADANDTVRAFAFSGDGGGSLEELDDSPFDTGAPASLAYQCAGTLAIHIGTRRLFVANSDRLSVFDIDPRTGALQAVDGSPFPFEASVGFTGIAVDQAGNRLFAASYGNRKAIHSFAIGSTGEPTLVDDRPFAGNFWGDRLLLSASEKYVYVNPGEYSTSDGIRAVVVASNGTLSELDDSPFASVALSNGAGIRPGHDQLVSTADEQSPAAGIHLFSFDDADGALVEDAGSPFAHPLDAFPSPQLAWAQDGNRLFISGFDSEVAAFQTFDVADDGTLSAAGAPNRDLLDMWCMHVSGDGRYLISTTNGDVTTVQVLELPEVGRPAPLDHSPLPFTGATRPRGIATSF